MARDMRQTLARARAALARGHGAEVAKALARELKQPSLGRKDELTLRCALAEAWLLHGDFHQAGLALGRPPESSHERIDPAHLSTLWRLHGRVAAAGGEQSPAIALLGRALAQAERSRDTQAIGLAHYELGLCYRTLGDTATVREHLAKSTDALRAADDRRHLGLVRSLAGVTLAQEGRFDEALVVLGEAERMAASAKADDVVAIVCGNQANVALMQHHHEQALALAERSVVLHERTGSRQGLSVSLATLGQICVRLGNLDRAQVVLRRALDTRSMHHFQETTGAVFDSLAQVHLMRGDYDAAADYLQQARQAYGEYGQQVSRWYEWSLRVFDATLALRRGDVLAALQRATEISRAPDVPARDALQADLIAAEALLAAGRHAEADARLSQVGARVERGPMIGTWAEYLRLRGQLGAETGRDSSAYHDLSQSITVFELIGERWHAGLSRLALGKLAAQAGATSQAVRYLDEAVSVFEQLGAKPILEETRAIQVDLDQAGTDARLGAGLDSDAEVVRRLVDAAVLTDLLSREAIAAMVDSCDADAGVLFVQRPEGAVRTVATAGGADATRALARAAGTAGIARDGTVLMESVGRHEDGPLLAALSRSRPFGDPMIRRFRMMALVARQGFELCTARDRPLQSNAHRRGRALETLLPGFICSSAAMSRVVDQIQRLQDNDLPVLITGESGTGKELVAQAIHVGSRRRTGIFLPHNCTSTTKELADSQLFGHRRGSFTGAIADQPGVARSAEGGTLFLDEIGDLPLDIQPKLLRFLEQGEILPVGDPRPLRVDVRVIAATNADLQQRVTEGSFREDLFYRLGVIRIHVPPLRERREEIPHLTGFFLREACERFGKPDVELGADTQELFGNHAWPGNIRQLKNEILRAVAMSAPGEVIDVDHLSPEVSGPMVPQGEIPKRRALDCSVSLAAAVEQLERQLIRSALDSSASNISETARELGLTRRGLYLKLRRLGMEPDPTV